MKRILLISFLVLSFFQVYSQGKYELGVSYQSNILPFRTFHTQKLKLEIIGYSIGGSFSYFLNSRASIVGSLHYSKFDWTISDKYSDCQVGNENRLMTGTQFFEFNTLFRYQFLKKAWVTPYFSTGFVQSLSLENSPELARYSKYNWGLMLAIGARIQLDSHFSISTDVSIRGYEKLGSLLQSQTYLSSSVSLNYRF